MLLGLKHGELGVGIVGGGFVADDVEAAESGGFGFEDGVEDTDVRILPVVLIEFSKGEGACEQGCSDANQRYHNTIQTGSNRSG